MKNVIKVFTVLFLVSLNVPAQTSSILADVESKISENTRRMAEALNAGDYVKFSSFLLKTRL